MKLALALAVLSSYKAHANDDTYDTLSKERNQASVAQVNGTGLFDLLLDAQLFDEDESEGGGFYIAAAAHMYSPRANIFVRPYDGCWNEKFGLNDGNYTTIVCDGFDRNIEVCTLEPTCNADDYMENTKYRATKGEHLNNTDDVLKLLCYKDADFASLMESIELTCDNAPILPKNGDIEAAYTKIEMLQGAIKSAMAGGFSNEILTQGREYYRSGSITLGDSLFAYSEAINGPKGFSTELVFKSILISDFASYHLVDTFCDRIPDLRFQIGVMESFFSQKYSCLTFNDDDREQLSDFIKFYYGAEVCQRNIGVMLALKHDNATAAFENLQFLKTQGDDNIVCENCSCVTDEVQLEAATIARKVLKSGKSAGKPDGCKTPKSAKKSEGAKARKLAKGVKATKAPKMD